jgi:hypothetical protein
MFKLTKQLLTCFLLLFLTQQIFAGRYYDSKTGRWISVDPMAEKYQGWSPYNYVLNNPVKLIDPNGKWIPHLDSNGNIIASYQKGDTYENLYKQLGMTPEKFAEWTTNQGIQLSDDPSGSSFNITSFALKQSDFSTDNSNLNCYSSSLYGTGAVGEEMFTPSEGVNYTTALLNFGYQNKENVSPGTLVTWTNESTNITEHMAIYVITGNDGTKYYVGRPGLYTNVIIQNSNNTDRLYAGSKQQYFVLPYNKPK